MGPGCPLWPCQVMSSTEPAATFWSWAGTVRAAKLAVWATTEEARASTAAEIVEQRMLKSREQAGRDAKECEVSRDTKNEREIGEGD